MMEWTTMRLSISIFAVAGAAAALVPRGVWAQAQPEPYRYEYGPHMMWWDGGWYGMMFGPLFMILMLAVVIAVVFLLVRWLGAPWQGTHQVPPGETALNILKERLARGEIDKDEYEEKRRLISQR
jgi:putative membrane protein